MKNRGPGRPWQRAPVAWQTQQPGFYDENPDELGPAAPPPPPAETIDDALLELMHRQGPDFSGVKLPQSPEYQGQGQYPTSPQFEGAGRFPMSPDFVGEDQFPQSPDFQGQGQLDAGQPKFDPQVLELLRKLLGF